VQAELKLLAQQGQAERGGIEAVAELVDHLARQRLRGRGGLPTTRAVLDFFAQDDHVVRRLDAEADHVAPDGNHFDGSLDAGEQDLFIQFAGQYEHV